LFLNCFLIVSYTGAIKSQSGVDLRGGRCFAQPCGYAARVAADDWPRAGSAAAAPATAAGAAAGVCRWPWESIENIAFSGLGAEINIS
jgi:hypothetical protein